MNRQYQPISTRLRAVFAAGAVLATFVTTGSIAALVAHYTDSQPAAVTVAQR